MDWQLGSRVGSPLDVRSPGGVVVGLLPAWASQPQRQSMERACGLWIIRCDGTHCTGGGPPMTFEREVLCRALLSASGIALLVVGCVGSDELRTTPSPAPAACNASPVLNVEIPSVGRVQMRSGQGLLGPADIGRGEGTKGQGWLVAMSGTPPLVLRMQGVRLDGDMAIEFELIRDSMSRRVTLPDGTQGHVYLAATLTPVFPEAGCWRVSATSPPASVVIPVY